jgi:FkbM family methyltransferase
MKKIRLFRKVDNPVTFSEFLPRNRLINLLRHWRFKTVIDAGSHDGTWSKDVVPLLNLLPSPMTVLIDPIRDVTPENFETIRKHSDVKSFRVAVGAARSTKTFKIASNFGESSSFLELGQNHIDAAPEVVFERSELIEIIPLDDLLSSVTGPCLLKLDLQGYELEALAGAKKTLASVEVAVVEASLVEAYVGGSTLKSLISFFELNDFRLVGMTESFSEKNLGAMVQMDAVFSRNPSS